MRYCQAGRVHVGLTLRTTTPSATLRSSRLLASELVGLPQPSRRLMLAKLRTNHPVLHALTRACIQDLQ